MKIINFKADYTDYTDMLCLETVEDVNKFMEIKRGKCDSSYKDLMTRYLNGDQDWEHYAKHTSEPLVKATGMMGQDMYDTGVKLTKVLIEQQDLMLQTVRNNEVVVVNVAGGYHFRNPEKIQITAVEHPNKEQLRDFIHGRYKNRKFIDLEKDKRNLVRVFYEDKEVSIPFGWEWREINPDNIEDVMLDAYTAVLNYFKTAEPDFTFHYILDTISIPNSQVYKEYTDGVENYPKYKEEFVKSHCLQVAKGINDAYYLLLEACKDHEDKDYTYLGYYMLNYLFFEVLGGSKKECWIMRDGSIIPVDFGLHRGFIEDFCNKKEMDAEKYYVKISSGVVYTHKNMTKEQWNTLKELSEKYNLTENYSLLECKGNEHAVFMSLERDLEVQ